MTFLLSMVSVVKTLHLIDTDLRDFADSNQPVTLPYIGKIKPKWSIKAEKDKASLFRPC